MNFFASDRQRFEYEHELYYFIFDLAIDLNVNSGIKVLFYTPKIAEKEEFKRK